MEATAKAFLRLVQIMDELREQCPWDKKQTIHTLRSMTLEEVYELADAIDAENWEDIKEELGDIMLHLLFYTRIGKEEANVQLEDVLGGIAEKLIKRHPHIYGNTIVENEEDVKKNWQKIKTQEGQKTVLGGVPKALPAIVKAMRIQEKVRQVGFDWEQPEDVFSKVHEELSELNEAVQLQDQDAIEQEFGDFLFSVINYARFLQVDPEKALERTNRKFTDRFNKLEAKSIQKGKQLTELSLKEMDVIWNQIKQEEKKTS